MQRATQVLLPFLLLALSGCQPEDVTSTAPLESVQQPIVNGTRDPRAVDLSEGQQLAIGWLHQRGYPPGAFCTGTIIAPRVVATAEHCVQGVSAGRIGFGIGTEPSEPVATFDVAEIHIHPSVDAAILILDQDATNGTGVTPIPANTSILSSSLVGSAIQAGGYGQTRDQNRTGRWFATVYLEAVRSTEIIVDGRGDQGICFGDSGGPAIATLDPRVGPVVLGVESHGDESCVDRDVLTRLDAIYSEFIGPVLSGDMPLGACDGLSYQGQCDGDIAEWCQDDIVQRRDCSSMGTSCGFVNEEIGYACTCGDIGEYGRCNGGLVEWCDQGLFRQMNCEAQGETCGWAGSQVGYFCTNRARCGPSDGEGRCDGDVMISCLDGLLETIDCGRSDLACALDDTGFPICVEPMDSEVSDPLDRPEPGSPGIPTDGNTTSGCRTVQGSSSMSLLFLLPLALLFLGPARRRHVRSGRHVSLGRLEH
jgi:hypothetical protein